MAENEPVRDRAANDQAAKDNTTGVVQRYLNELAEISGDAPAEPLIRQLLTDSVGRLQILCTSLLFRSYHRLTQPPLNLQPEELLSAVVERMIKALRSVQPRNVRQFFALANQHMRWELNDLARRLDKQTEAQLAHESMVAAPQSSSSQLSGTARKILGEIEALPEEEREAFDLVRIQGLSQPDAAALLGVSPKTVQRRLSRALIQLSERLSGIESQPQRTEPA
jgi:RNA polymerase sigma factor (sigma-70 family)